ncbi:hypothetical protein Tsubulata_016571 [Turnera subulata]|uniref:Pectinesterase inhibitor domain-containing protein n=1 Tax=Turnera subulata TaxID=218843 RepID=A0A9Q0J6F8_9ROSI|nr:hypothetical protein Tsubulata_016571 [Turnera subulata]
MKVTIFKFLLTLMFVVIYQASTIPPVNADLIDDACKKTDFPKLCASTVRSDGRWDIVDVKQIADVVLDQTAIKVNATLQQAQKLISQTIDPDVKKTLNFCSGLYESAIDSDIPDALNNVESEDYKTAIEDAKAVGKDAKGCEDAFTAAKVSSPLASHNKNLSQLGRIAVQIIQILA